MGKGEIVSHDGDGKYQVKLKYFRDRYEQEINRINTSIEKVEWKISSDPDVPAGSTEYSIAKLQLASLQKQKEFLQNAFPDDPTVEAWCADLTTDLTGDVATIEVPGEPQTVQIAPGFTDDAAYVPAKHGQLTPAMGQTATGLFYNWAMLPGWQKWRPTFRHATITSITGDKCDLTLENATSSQQSINVNQTSDLTDVTIEYMDCNGVAFAVGDKVLVKFEDQDWSKPKVIGFKENPNNCFVHGLLFSIDKKDNTLTYDSTEAAYKVATGNTHGMYKTCNWIGHDGDVICWYAGGRYHPWKLGNSSSNGFIFNGNEYAFNTEKIVGAALTGGNKIIVVTQANQLNNNRLEERFYFADITDIENPRLVHNEVYDDIVKYGTYTSPLHLSSSWLINASGTTGFSTKRFYTDGSGDRAEGSYLETYSIDIDAVNETIQITNVDDQYPRLRYWAQTDFVYESDNWLAETSPGSGSSSTEYAGKETFWDYDGDTIVSMSVTINNRNYTTYNRTISSSDAGVLRHDTVSKSTDNDFVLEVNGIPTTYPMNDESAEASWYGWDPDRKPGDPFYAENYSSGINEYPALDELKIYGWCDIDARVGLMVMYALRKKRGEASIKSRSVSVQRWDSDPYKNFDPVEAEITEAKRFWVLPDGKLYSDDLFFDGETFGGNTRVEAYYPYIESTIDALKAGTEAPSISLSNVKGGTYYPSGTSGIGNIEMNNNSEWLAFVTWTGGPPNDWVVLSCYTFDSSGNPKSRYTCYSNNDNVENILNAYTIPVLILV